MYRFHLAFLVVLSSCFYALADLSVKDRGKNPEEFIAKLGDAIIKAAHGTGKKPKLVRHSLTAIPGKLGRMDLKLTMEYFGVVTTKLYEADIIVHLAVNKDDWEVLNIDYTDNNIVPANIKKIQALIKSVNLQTGK